MWRKLNKEDLAGSNPLIVGGRRHHEFYWPVYPDYAVFERDGDSYFVVPQDDSRPTCYYRPLIDTPHLFLEFARLCERKDPDRALVADWGTKHGLLGLQSSERRRPFSDFPGTDTPPREYEAVGGPMETMSRTELEMWRAYRALNMYEAALSKDVEKLERVWRIRGSTPAAKAGQRFFQSKAESASSTYAEALVDGAVQQTLASVHKVLAAFAYPYLAQRSTAKVTTPNEPLTPELLTASLWPRNLLGAMYIQFYWLIASGSDLSRCRYCGRIISHAAPALLKDRHSARKPRRDKRFCDSRCRQNYHYHNRIKSARKD